MSEMFDKLNDDQLIDLIKNGNSEAMEYMLKRHGNIVKREIRTVYLIGAETEDLAQEGMIGLFKAIRDYETGKGAVFTTFATLCVRRQIQTAINVSNRKKHSPLNSYISFYDNSNDNENGTFTDMEDSKKGINPEDVILQREQMDVIANMINNKLSKYERAVLNLYLEGLPYGDIAVKLGKTNKSIDNALQRIRGKISLT